MGSAAPEEGTPASPEVFVGTGVEPGPVPELTVSIALKCGRVFRCDELYVSAGRLSTASIEFVQPRQKCLLFLLRRNTPFPCAREAAGPGMGYPDRLTPWIVRCEIGRLPQLMQA